jgi:hypothetical protein
MIPLDPSQIGPMLVAWGFFEVTPQQTYNLLPVP